MAFTSISEVGINSRSGGDNSNMFIRPVRSTKKEGKLINSKPDERWLPIQLHRGYLFSEIVIEMRGAVGLISSQEAVMKSVRNCISYQCDSSLTVQSNKKGSLIDDNLTSQSLRFWIDSLLNISSIIIDSSPGSQYFIIILRESPYEGTVFVSQNDTYISGSKTLITKASAMFKDAGLTIEHTTNLLSLRSCGGDDVKIAVGVIVDLSQRTVDFSSDCKLPLLVSSFPFIGCSYCQSNIRIQSEESSFSEGLQRIFISGGRILPHSVADIFRSCRLHQSDCTIALTVNRASATVAFLPSVISPPWDDCCSSQDDDQFEKGTCPGRIQLSGGNVWMSDVIVKEPKE